MGRPRCVESVYDNFDVSFSLAIMCSSAAFLDFSQAVVLNACGRIFRVPNFRNRATIAAVTPPACLLKKVIFRPNRVLNVTEPSLSLRSG